MVLSDNQKVDHDAMAGELTEFAICIADTRIIENAFYSDCGDYVDNIMRNAGYSQNDARLVQLEAFSRLEAMDTCDKSGSAWCG
jgi:hypothetical protein